MTWTPTIASLYVLLVVTLYALAGLLLEYYTLLDIERGISALGTDLVEVEVEWIERCLREVRG